jgi:hypothetical protein
VQTYESQPVSTGNLYYYYYPVQEAPIIGTLTPHTRVLNKRKLTFLKAHGELYGRQKNSI